MDKSVFDLGKNSANSNMNDWVKNTPFIEYGVVRKVFDINTVRVQLVVSDSLSSRMYTVRILHEVSKLKEESVMPQENDLVLLLFLRNHSDAMFNDPAERLKTEKGLTITDTDCNNYNMFSGVGILLSTVKGRSATTISYGIDSEGPYVVEDSIARMTKAFHNALRLVFDVPRTVAGETPADKPIDITFGAGSPLSVTNLNKVERTYGVSRGPDGEFVETTAPVTETYGSKSPVEENLAAGVTVNIGTDEAGEATAAPVSVNLNEKSPLSIVSKEGLTIEFKKATIVKYGDTYTLEATGAVEIKGASVTLNTGDASTWMPNCVPTCPFGFPHGGSSGGIANLKGK